MSAHRYWRIKILSANGDTGTEWKNCDLMWLGAVLNTQSNATYSASFTFPGTNSLNVASPYTAAGWTSNFDNNFSNMWWACDFGLGNAVDVDAVALLTSNAARSPHQFYVQYSDDGTNWSTRWIVVTAGFSTKTTFAAPPPLTGSSTSYLSQEYALVVYTAGVNDTPRTSQHYAMVPYTRAGRAARVTQEYALVVWTNGVHDAPRESQHYALVVWGITPPGAENRTRAWKFTLDGHLFYVLDLGVEGTFVYDMDTGEWSEFITSGFNNWNMHVGTTWQAPNRVVAGDLLDGYLLEINPTDVLDEDFRTIEHVVTGGVMTRSRVFLGVESIRLSGSVGQIQDDVDGVETKLRFSDDAGKTWSDYYVVTVGQGDFGDELAYRSLGSFMAPGRVFEFSDQGGMLRIDGADLFLENFDDESELTVGYRQSN